MVDLTTSTPTLAEKIAKTATEKGAAALDAPVSGGDLGAKNATLTIMVGGEKSVYEKVLPLFQVMGSTFTLHGTAGKGQHAKMANQIMIAGTMTGMTELLAYASKAGLDFEKVIETVSGGSAANWSLSNYAPRILKEDYTPGFFVKHFIKDLKIALDEADKMALKLPATTQALKLYEHLADQGFENDGTQALIKLWWPEGKNRKKKILKNSLFLEKINASRLCFCYNITEIRKGGPPMAHSQLVAIIKRLEAMVESADNELQVRRFEKEGVEKCTVTYDKATETFELTETDSHQQYEFDNIDIVAMEIYDLIQ